MNYKDCCVLAVDGEKLKPTKYTHGHDWSLEGNRPVVNQPADMKQATANKPADTGLIVRQQL